MRRIIFRGKRILDNKWVFGDLIYRSASSNNKVMILETNDINAFIVDENTVGQFTGLYDKNGVEIFEGDIVIADFDYKKEPMEVIYYKCGFKLKSKKCKEVYDYSIHDETPELEVIGNIYDNKELLEG